MCSARNTYAECTKNTYADDTTADTVAWAAQLSGLVCNDETWIGGNTHLVQLADTLDRGDGERHILVACILVLVFLIYSCTTCVYTNTPDTVMAGAKLADLEMQEKNTKTLRKTVQQKKKYTRKTGKMAGESRKKKTKTANKSLSTEAMKRSRRRVGGAARKAVEDVSHAWRC